jgi:hypothetical protein
VSFTCPTCHAPFTLQAVVATRPGVPVSVAIQPLDAGAVATVQPSPWRCPVHDRSKIVPAGISKKSGKPYQSFAACPEDGCSWGQAQVSPGIVRPPSPGARPILR